MNSATDAKTPKIFSPFKQPPPLLNLQQAFSDLQTHCSSLVQQTHHHLKGAFDCTFSHFNPPFLSPKGPVFTRIADSSKTKIDLSEKSGVAMSAEAIEESMAGVPVYALNNSEEKFVLVSGVSTKTSLGLFCFKKEDAEALLEQMKSMDPRMRRGSKVVAVALNKVFQMRVDGVALRLIPESAQIKNALRPYSSEDVPWSWDRRYNKKDVCGQKGKKLANQIAFSANLTLLYLTWQDIMERERAGFSDDGFPGIPVFESRCLILRSQNKSYRPVFFRKEDLEQSLLRASCPQNQLKPAFRPGDIQVAVFEEIIKWMKDGSTSMWDDVVFIPPGFEVPTDPTQQQ
ncbi:Tic22-like family protein isoform 1 [Theobroma cacao]|uniref:Tic22-like family protein isoform 1 n=1 Tax=Theobroma cacao TaxID=3641 RepID=A0A061EKC0_THECC|nr:Tic22-like family protein isoform 1 [Theobroma cacao]